MNAIVVADRNWAIGRDNGLLFSLPRDMKRFRTLTAGGTLIMGRKTLDSFPGGRPLPKRRNIVITRDPAFQREGCEVVHSPAEALALAGGGSDEAARAVLELYGLDPNSVGNYRTIAGRQLATTLATKSAGGSGSSSGRRSSGTKGSGSSWTNSQLQSMAKTFSSMKGNEPLYDFYKRTLTDAGWIKDDTPNLLETNRGLTGQSWKGDPENKWGTGTSNRQSQSTGRTASQSSVPQRAQVAANAIKGQRNHGSDDQTIFDSLKHQGYTDDEIWKAFELAG